MVLDAMRTAYFPNSVEADYFMRMRYETAYGIFNHDAPDDPKVPWPLLAMSELESLEKVDPLDFRLDQFIENEVFKAFGIPFNELIQYPRADYVKYIKFAKKHAAKLANVSSDLLAKLEAGSKVAKNTADKK